MYVGSPKRIHKLTAAQDAIGPLCQVTVFTSKNIQTS